jgi:hypothetical protein
MLTSARNHYRAQQRLTALGVSAARRVATRGPVAVAASVGQYQAASALLAASATEAAIAEQGITAPASGTLSAGAFVTGAAITDALSQIDTDFAFARLVATLLQDAGREAAGVAIAARPALEGHVRHLNPPSCARCAILAGRFYRWSDGFDRHPLCDCVMVATNEEPAQHLIVDPMDAFRRGQIKTSRKMPDGSRRMESGLSEADTKAIEDGADISQVVNSHRGMGQSTAIKGVRFDFTLEGTTARGRYGRSGPAAGSLEKRAGERYRRTTKSRLTPGTIYRVARDRAHAIEMLKHYGYLT